MLNYFSNCKTIEDLKKEYFRLAKLHHPDVGGDTETMKAINNEYDKVFPRLKNKHRNAETGAEYTKETAETVNEYPEIINAIIKFPGIVIEICGTWIWVSGNTKAYKENFKELGFRWSKNKFMWYWRKDENRCWWNRKSHDMDYIRERYGSERINNQPDPALA